MVIIDTHIHFCRIACFQEAALKESDCNYSLAGLAEELARKNVRAAIAMGLQETAPPEKYLDKVLGGQCLKYFHQDTDQIRRIEFIKWI